MNRTSGLTRARTIRKGFQMHGKQSRLIRNKVLNLSRIDSKKDKKYELRLHGVQPGCVEHQGD